MRFVLLSPAFALLIACGSGNSGEGNPDKNLSEAASQSDPAAAQAINQAQAAGASDQEALAAGGAAAAANDQAAAANAAEGPLQAKPNLPDDPNRKEDGRTPPDKMRGTTQEPGLRQNGQQAQPQPPG